MAPGRWCCPCFRPETDDITVLEYSHGNLDDVPTEIFTFERTLEELYLDANQIKDLPRPLFHCHGLKKLILSDNEIQSVPPAIASLINLEELDISKNGVLEIPDNIKGCKCLAIVDASANPLVRLPEGFTQLISLEELYLNDTFLEYLPANFGRLSRLKILELRENHLKVLPKSMTRLTELTRLDIGQNDFCEIPDVVGALSKLVELWCDNNKIQKIPACLNNLKRLAYLDASKNKIQELTPDFGLCGNLTDLTLTKNKIKHIPQSIGNLKKLSILRLDCNHLQALPPSIGNLVNLEEVVISFNSILSLPPSIGLLRNMHTFIADDNQLEELPPEIGSCVSLSILSLRNNKLHNVPAEIGHIGKLKVVNLTGNCLHHLPVSIGKLPNLHALWLAENQTKPLIPLQSDVELSTGQKVLTCFMLPQSPVEQEGRAEVYTPDSEAEREERQIKFAADVSSDRSGKLVRAPTPYPKELKAHARYARNYILKKLEMNGQVRTDEEDVHHQNGPSKLREVPDGMVVPSSIVESHGAVVREAKVTKPMSPVNPTPFSQQLVSNSGGQVHDDIPTVHCSAENSPPTSGKIKKPKMLPVPPDHIVQQVRTQQPSSCPQAYPRQLPAMQHATISRLCGDVQVPIQHTVRSQSAAAMSRSLSNIHQSHLAGRPPSGPQKETISEYLHVHPGSPRQLPADYSPGARAPMKLNSTGEIMWFGGPNLPSQYKEEGLVLHQPYRVSGGQNRISPVVDVLQDGTLAKNWTHYPSKPGSYILHPSESGRSSPIMVSGHLPTYLNVSPTGRERPPNFYPVSRSPESFPDIPHIDESPVGEGTQMYGSMKPLGQCLESEERWSSYKRDRSPTSLYPAHQDSARQNSPDGLHPGSRHLPIHPSQRQHGWLFGVHRNPLVFPVSIHKNPDLGFTVEGGIGTPKNLNKPDDESIYIDHVAENSRASMVLKSGDKILQVDGIDFTFVDQNKARIVLQSAGPTVNLLISRG